MTTKHEPTAEFQQFLEWQVTSAVRRQDRFSAPARTGYRRHLAAALLVVVSMIVGGAGVAAAARIQSNQQRDLLVEQLQGELQLAEMRVEIARSEFESARRRVEVGIASPASAQAAERELRLTTLDYELLQLNIEEVRQSGQPVQDDVTSPLVDGRDFVTARLQKQQEGLALAANAASSAVRDVRARHDIGLASALEVLEVETRAFRAVNEVQVLQEQISLRRRFLDGALTAAEATRQRLILMARHQLEVVEHDLELARERYERLQRQFDVGVVHETDLLQGRLQMLTLQQDEAALLTRIQALLGGGR